jgi:hypothetical protein
MRIASSRPPTSTPTWRSVTPSRSYSPGSNGRCVRELMISIGHPPLPVLTGAPKNARKIQGRSRANSVGGPQRRATSVTRRAFCFQAMGADACFVTAAGRAWQSQPLAPAGYRPRRGLFLSAPRRDARGGGQGVGVLPAVLAAGEAAPERLGGELAGGGGRVGTCGRGGLSLRHRPHVPRQPPLIQPEIHQAP